MFPPSDLCRSLYVAWPEGSLRSELDGTEGQSKSLQTGCPQPGLLLPREEEEELRGQAGPCSKSRNTSSPCSCLERLRPGQVNATTGFSEHEPRGQTDPVQTSRFQYKASYGPASVNPGQAPLPRCLCLPAPASAASPGSCCPGSRVPSATKPSLVAPAGFSVPTDPPLRLILF